MANLVKKNFQGNRYARSCHDWHLEWQETKGWNSSNLVNMSFCCQYQEMSIFGMVIVNILVSKLILEYEIN